MTKATDICTSTVCGWNISRFLLLTNKKKYKLFAAKRGYGLSTSSDVKKSIARRSQAYHVDQCSAWECLLGRASKMTLTKLLDKCSFSDDSGTLKILSDHLSLRWLRAEYINYNYDIIFLMFLWLFSHNLTNGKRWCRLRWSTSI